VLGKRKVEENFSSFPPFRVGEKKSGGGIYLIEVLGDDEILGIGSFEIKMVL